MGPKTDTKRQRIQATTYDDDTYDTYEYDIYKQQLLRWTSTSNDKRKKDRHTKKIHPTYIK
ncbi:9687_t:CDS:2, partial [Dentiscutata heterogama]